MMYQVCYNNAAGEGWIQPWTNEDWENWDTAGVRNQYGHFNVIGEFKSKAEAEAALEELRGDPVFVVFDNGPAGEAFVSEEDGLSGNWRGSKYGHFSNVGEYREAADAEAHKQRLEEYYLRLKEKQWDFLQ